MSTATALRAAATGKPQETPETTVHPYEALKRQLEGSKAEFLPLMGGSQANVDAFVRVVLNAVLGNPDLLAADRRSLIASCMKAAQDGLMPDGREAVLNIYPTNTARRGEPDKWVQLVQYLPMVGGLIKNLYLSGEILTLDAAVVFENDKFRWVRGDAPHLEHEPTMSNDPGGIIAAYCVVKLKSGELKREVMAWRDIEMVRGASKSSDGKNSPWMKWLDQMAIKSVIKRIRKQLPSAERFDQVERSDNEAMGFAATPQSVADITARHGAPAASAITHQPAETMDFSTGNVDSRDAVPLRSANDESRQDQRRAEVPSFNVAAFIARVDACTTTDGLDILSDDVRSIEDPAVRQTLEAVINARSAKLDQPTGAPPVQAARAPRRAANSMPEV